MRCRDAMELIHEELDGTASAESLARLREHLQACASCAREHEAFGRQEALLREPDPDEPGDAYFEQMARAVAFETRKRERRPVGGLVHSWAFSTALAAACLLIGLSVGHVALPKTITRTERVMQPVKVAGPVREVKVPVEKIVTHVVKVPVEVVRTRTVVKRVYVPTAAPTPEAPVAAVATVPTTTDVLSVASSTGHALGLGARPAAGSSYGTSAGYGVAFASASAGAVTSSDLRLIASRLRSDMSTVDDALGTPTLAATLATDMGRAEAEMDRSLRAAPAATPATPAAPRDDTR